MPAPEEVSAEPVLRGMDGAMVELEATAASLEETGTLPVGAAADETVSEGAALLGRAVIGQTVV